MPDSKGRPWTADTLRKAYHHAMSDPAVAASVHVWYEAQLKRKEEKRKRRRGEEE